MNAATSSPHDLGVASPVPIGTVIAERYRVDGVLGVGGMGVVVKATHVILQQPVAIKFLRREAMVDPEAVERFVREARAAACVQSDYVVRVQDVAMLDDQTPFIVMEYVEGRDLAEILAERGTLTADEVITYALQACEALIETHAAGIVHGDLKPENVFVATASEGHGRAKLIDFGISGVFVDGESRTSRLVAGTPAYMAPEQLKNGGVSVRSDIWALGAVMYELLAGTPPFGADDPTAIYERATRDPVARLERNDVPAMLHAVIDRCLEKDPSRRFEHVREIAALLEPIAPFERSNARLVRTSPKATPQTVAAQRSAPTVVAPLRLARTQRRLAAIAVLATFILAGIGVVAIVTTARTPESPTTGTPVAPATQTNSTTAIVPAAPSSEPPEIAVGSGSVVRPPVASPGAHPRIRAPRPASTPEPRRATDPAPSGGDRFGTRK